MFAAYHKRSIFKDSNSVHSEWSQFHFFLESNVFEVQILPLHFKRKPQWIPQWRFCQWHWYLALQQRITNCAEKLKPAQIFELFVSRRSGNCFLSRSAGNLEEAGHVCCRPWHAVLTRRAIPDRNFRRFSPSLHSYICCHPSFSSPMIFFSLFIFLLCLCLIILLFCLFICPLFLHSEIQFRTKSFLWVFKKYISYKKHSICAIHNERSFIAFEKSQTVKNMD